MRNSLETRLGIFVALAALAAVLILEMVGGFERFWGGDRYHAMFQNIRELKVGDRVRMAGVEVGRVENIELAGNRVRVTLRVREEANVKTDSTASIQFTGLMGQSFVALDFGSPEAPRAETDTILPTYEQPDLGALISRPDNVAIGVENLTRSFTGDQLDNLLGPVTDFIRANHATLTATFSNMQSVSEQIARGDGTVGRLIFDDTLYVSAVNTVTNLQSTTDDIRLTLTQTRTVMDQVNAGQGTLGRLLNDELLYTETASAMTNLREILEKINTGDGTAGRFVNDPELYRNARLTLQKLDKATEGLEDQGPLSVLGILVNGLF